MPESEAWSVGLTQTPVTGLRHPALVEKVAGKRSVECGADSKSSHWFTTSCLSGGLKLPESEAWSVGLTQNPITGLRHPALLEDGAGKRGVECCGLTVGVKVFRCLVFVRMLQ